MSNKYKFIPKRLQGFTLIELLVVLGIFVVLSTIILGVLATVLRSTKNSNSLIEVRQNGDYVMSQIVSNLRFAGSLNYPEKIGGAFPSCSPAGTKVDKITITNLDQTQKTVSCPSNFNIPNFISLDTVQLTNINTVQVGDCYFICTQTAGSGPTIGIFYTLLKVNTNGVPEGNVKIPFKSSVTLRNIGG